MPEPELNFAPCLVRLFSAPQKACDETDAELGARRKVEEPGDGYHVNARHLLYPTSPVTRFPVPNEKVPWEVSACPTCVPRAEEARLWGGGRGLAPYPSSNHHGPHLLQPPGAQCLMVLF